MSAEIISQIEKLRSFFYRNETKNIAYRLNALKKLRSTIKKYEKEILNALYQDLGKSNFESYVTEIAIVLKEVDYFIKHIRKWSKLKKKCTPILFFLSKSWIYTEPYGVVLIIAPWNYPFQLLLNPLVAAIGAGNCVALKTSPQAPTTASIVEQIITESFNSDYVAIFHGNRDINQLLLSQKFDYIFFTGSPALGKIVMEAAARNLIPVTLELGGKSPCIIDESADLTTAAKRIIWGKCTNAGQTCIAPDYLLVHKRIKSDFVLALQQAVAQMYGEKPQISPDYPQIISTIALKRLITYLKMGKIIFGGKYDEGGLYFSPTVMEDVSEDSPLMQEEIFGPILPLFEFQDMSEVIQFINKRDKPLALYFFSKNKKNSKKIIEETSSGGMCINDTLIHIANHRLPFGGVGNSGMGNYHGKFGFDTFSHKKAVVRSSFFIDIPLKYPPHQNKLTRLKKIL